MKIRPFLLALVLSVAFLGSSGTLAQEASESDFVDEILQSLSPREKIGQLFVVGFQGPEVSPEVSQFIADHKIGGVFLSRENCNVFNGTAHDPGHCGFPAENDPDTPAQIASLTQQLQNAACDATAGSVGDAPYCLPLFITVDHEGDGRPLTRILNRFTPIPSGMAIGATFDPSRAEAVGCIVGKELAAVGINMLLGPDLDVLDSPTSGGPGDQGIRVFGGDPRWVAEMGTAYVRGVQQCGEGQLATVAKHFPGHGRSTREVDTESIVLVHKTLEELGQVDLAPFAAASRGEPGGTGITDAMMNSHLTYTAVVNCDGRTPVTFSPACMQAFVRLPNLTAWRQAGGLTLADDLAAGAVQAYSKEKYGGYRQAQLALEALLSENDVLPLIRQWQWEALESTVDYLVSRYEVDEEVRVRVDDAARRVIDLKYRLYQGLDMAVITAEREYRGIVGQQESAETVASVAEGAATFIRPSSPSESAVPAPTAGERVLFIECWDDPTCAPPGPDYAPQYPPLWRRGKLASLAVEMFPEQVSAENLRTISFSELGGFLSGTNDDVRVAVEEADWLVFAFLELDPDFPASRWLKEFLQIGREVSRNKKVVVFAYSSPYHLDAGELMNVDLFVALYSKIEPSLKASLRILYQYPTISSDSAGRGSLPVDYIYGEYILYDLSEQVKPDPSQDVELAFEPEQPIEGQEFTVSLVQPLLARNGHRVSNGTTVDFVFELPNGIPQQVSTVTGDGLAEASVPLSEPGELRITVRSGDLEWPAEPITVRAPEPSPGPQDGPTITTDDGGGGFPIVLVASLAGAAPLAAAALALVLYQRRRRRRLEEPTPERPAVQPELRVELTTHRVFVKGRDITPPLSKEQYELLAYLYQNAGKLCAREDIIRCVWLNAEVTGVSEEALDSLVHRLRERLRAAGVSKPLIVTVRGQGFRLDL